MDETLGTILFVGMLIVFGGYLLVAATISLIMGMLERAVKLLQRLGYAAIIPAGIYVLLKYMDRKDASEDSSATQVSDSDGSGGRWRSRNVGQSLLPSSKSGPRNSADARGRGVRR